MRADDWMGRQDRPIQGDGDLFYGPADDAVVARYIELVGQGRVEEARAFVEEYLDQNMVVVRVGEGYDQDGPTVSYTWTEADPPADAVERALLAGHSFLDFLLGLWLVFKSRKVLRGRK
jgi:hypothetical protein